MNRLTRFLVMSGAAMSLLGAVGPAQAFPDQAAGIDAQLRPNFGGLIAPPLRPRWRPDRRRHDQYRPGRRPGWPRERTAMSWTADCTDARDGDTPINDGLQNLADYGTLYVRGVCHESVWIDHPVTIVGQGASIFDEGSGKPATITPPDGETCIRVNSNVEQVEIRDMVLSTEHGGRASCVETWDSKVALVRTVVRYWGDTTAVLVTGGKLILSESFIDARTLDAAVVVDGGLIEMSRSRILGEEAGLDLTPGVGDSRIVQSGVFGRDAGLPAGNGIMVHGQRSGSGALKIDNTMVCGWRNGLHLDRASIVTAIHSRFCRNTVGVVSDGDLTLTESVIGAREVGIYAATGRAALRYNRIYGWSDRAIWMEPGVEVVREFNYVYYDQCWTRNWSPGEFCQRTSQLPQAARDDSVYSSPYRDWWEADAYERGYQRDGAPTFQAPIGPPPPPAPPPRRRWGKRNR